MLVYAKQSFRASPRHLARSLRWRIAQRPLADLQEARAWLIAAGQLEQAVLDAGLDSGGRATAATLSAAVLFLDARSGAGGARIRTEAERLRSVLHDLDSGLDGGQAEFRVPEGFAWYALYPDSYAQTAEDWSRRFGRTSHDVSVIGLRSIGTTLAAVVAETLRRNGLTVANCATLRPSGDPFHRRAELPRGIVPSELNIVVDEGPGLSGSSMVAVARALRHAGADARSIHFFAGHRGGPGAAATAPVDDWWSGDRVWTTDPDGTVIGGSPLPDVLASLAEDCAGEPAAGPVEPLGTAGWRWLAGLPALPRAIAPGLEAPKKLARLNSGRQVLLKFAGLPLPGVAVAGSAPRVGRRAAVPVRGCRHGWVGMPWVEGVRLTPADADTAFLNDHLAPWIAAAATGELEPQEVWDGLARISAALAAWARARDDAASAVAIGQLAERACTPAHRAPQPGYGDGRLAPHEWIRSPDGRIHKVDGYGHAGDHTWVGRQPLAWDLAGAEVEWGLDARRAGTLCGLVQRLTGYACSAGTRAVYRAGYCVFRAAAARHCAATSSDAPMRAHLSEAGRWYERRIEAALTLIAAEPAGP